MKKIAIYLCLTCSLVLIFPACSKREQRDLELNIINSSLGCYSKNSNKDSIVILRYSLTNNSETLYYLNNIIPKDSLMSKFVIYKNGINLSVYDKLGKEVKYEVGHNNTFHNDGIIDYQYNKANDLESKLGYNHQVKYFRRFDNENFFFIYPHQTIFFECFISLNNILPFDGSRVGVVKLDSGKEYYGRISLASDSTKYTMDLPREIVKTIKVNNAKVYNGRIFSNKVPIKVID